MAKKRIPKFVRDWYRETYAGGKTATAEDIIDELCGVDWSRTKNGDWEQVQDEWIGDDKYWNVHEIVLKHRETGRFIRYHNYELPDGIEDYGGGEMEEEDREIEEVFPQTVQKTEYISEAEWKKKPRAPKARGG